MLAVPNSFREGSFGLGAGKLRTIFKIVLPSAVPGILAGVILAIGRMVGETAAADLYGRYRSEIPSSIMSSGKNTCNHMYSLSKEGLYTDQAYATAVVLLIVVVLINMLSNFVAKKFTKNRRSRWETNLKSKISICIMAITTQLKNINMNLAENEITAFIGPSGCGKSTFLKCLNRMNDLVEGCKITGSVTLDGEDIYGNMDGQ